MRNLEIMSAALISDAFFSSGFDPITLEIFWRRLTSIADEAATGLVRTTFAAAGLRAPSAERATFTSASSRTSKARK